MPPSIILEVLRILEKEIGLRDETRAVEQAREGLTALDYQQRAAPLAETQIDLARRVVEMIQTTRELPDGATAFAKEIALFTRVEQIMREAHALLSRPETGPETIAAETEIIELLLQAKRINPGGGGGGGGATPGGGNGGTTEESALALLGSGEERNAHQEMRTVGQSTGTSGSSLPAEFRSGLDAYFGAFEESRASRVSD